MTAPILELRNLSKSFGPVHAVKSVSLDVHAGEVIGLVGDNGAGKSTLTRMIAGTIGSDAGDIIVAGKKQSFRSAQDARRAGIETVFQTLALVPGLDIVENIFLVADRVCVLRLGRKVFDGAMSRLSGTDLVALMTGAATAVDQIQPDSAR